jgi:1-acyl-sn-glycerol-3-phosphate acyltransferase
LFRKKAIDAKLCFRIYYRKIEIINKHNIPRNQPIIIAPNHQNALMDAMVLVCNLPYQNVFLARADIFKGKRMIRFLTFANIMPIYRMRDGIENVKKDDEVFDKTVRVLHNNNYPLCLFAEGNHGDKRRLRPLVKGLFRIAFLAQEKFGEQPGVKIVPIGIDYGHYQNFRSTLFVNFGEPIEVSSFYTAYKENPALAINQLKDAFAYALGRQMIDIQSEEYYDLFMHLREIFNDDMRKVLGIQDDSLAGKFFADKTMIDCLNLELEQNPDHVRELNSLVLSHQQSLKSENLRDWVVKSKPFPVAGLLISLLTKFILLPVFLFGLLNNYLPYWFAASRVSNIKDTQFHSSFKYVIGMIAFPAWYIVLAGMLAFLSAPIWVIVLYVVLLPITGLAAFHYYIRFRKLLAKLKITINRNKPRMIQLKNNRMLIINRMHDIVNRHKTDHEGKR